MTSFTLIGIPSISDNGSPFKYLSSDALACSRANSSVIVMKQLRVGFSI